jgi:hypothetical protein
MRYGSGSGSGFGSRFGSGYNIKLNKKVKKIKDERQTFWEIMLLLTLESQDFVQIFLCWKTVLNFVWIRNRNQKFSKFGTGTATNHYGSTTLDHGRDGKEEWFNRGKEKDIFYSKEGIKWVRMSGAREAAER